MKDKKSILPPVLALKVSIEYVLDLAVSAGAISEEQATPIRREVWSLPTSEAEVENDAA